MGQAVIRCAKRSGEFSISAAFEIAGHPLLGKDAGDPAGTGPIGVVLTSDLAGIAQSDVLVDFTLHTAVPVNIQAARDCNKPAVIGTTGLTDAETAVVRNAATVIPIMWAPNMSLGVNLLFAMVQQAATTLGLQYRIDIDETHHVHKKDAPSGTALRLAERAAQGRGQDPKSAIVHETGSGPRGHHSAERIVVRSHRRGEVVGDHTVTFENDCETIELTHHAWSRDALAMGALHAARWVLKQPAGLYDMQTVLGLQRP